MEDLSHMLPASTGLTGGESMNAANMISDKPDCLMQAPGSAPLLPPYTPDNPDLDVPGTQNFRPLVNTHGSKAGD